MTNNKTNTATHAKAMAYMLDKEVWSVYKGEGAKYAIGGPTVELLLNSYNKKYGTSYSCEVQHEYGYVPPDVSFSTSDSLYVITNRPQGEYTDEYFVASPLTFKMGGVQHNEYVMRSYISRKHNVQRNAEMVGGILYGVLVLDLWCV